MFSRRNVTAAPSAMEVLSQTSFLAMNDDERAQMTISCHDADYIPKVKNAGSIITQGGKKVQIMHNGLKVQLGGYHGEWMARIITALKGHHEPQEEKAFYEVLQRLQPGATMVELGAFWAYYSLWFNKAIKNARNICCEPDPGNMAIGQHNAVLNNAKNVEFVPAAAGSANGALVTFALESQQGKTIQVPIKTVDALVDERKIDRLDVLHMDVQGQEIHALHGAKNAIGAGRVRFLVVSTHHHVFTGGDPLMHQRCLDFIKHYNGHIITEHTIAESFSGDGLIVASFDQKDHDMHIQTSLNHTDHSLFRPYEQDLAIMMHAYDELRAK